MNLNKAFIFGNLTRDPELRSLPSGQAVVNFGVATNRSWKDQQGQKRDQVEFHNVVAFGKQAEIIQQYMHKGSSMLVEGRLQTRTWDAQDGSKKSRTEIIVENFQFGPRPGGGAAPQEQSTNQPGKQELKEEDVATIQYQEAADEINPNDIPF